MAVEFKPFRVLFSELDNALYEFLAIGKSRKEYTVNIEIDELDDDLLITRSCTCDDFVMRKMKETGDSCKHLKEAFDILKKFNITWREF